MKLEILFENEKFVILTKIFGQEFHGESGVLAELRKLKPDCHGVHRLDKATSGLMIFAKGKDNQRKLSKLFEEKKIQKIYIALSHKSPRKKQGLIKGDLDKVRSGSFKLLRTQINPSITRFTSHFNDFLKVRAYLLYPLTGKTHQLRVVMKSLGSPILGDTRYGGQESDRMYLHACVLNFELDSVNYSFKDIPKLGEQFKSSEMKKFISKLINYEEEIDQ